MSLTSSSGRTRFVLRNLMRKVCISPSLLNGGPGVSPCLLGKLDTLNRELLGTNHNKQAAMEEELFSNAISPKEVMNLLLQSRKIAQTRSDGESGMIKQIVASKRTIIAIESMPCASRLTRRVMRFTRLSKCEIHKTRICGCWPSVAGIMPQNALPKVTTMPK